MVKFRLVSQCFVCLFLFLFLFLCAISADFFGRFAQGSTETVHFPGDFVAGKLSEIFVIFVFCAVVVTIFVFHQFIYLLLLLLLLLLFLVGVN